MVSKLIHLLILPCSRVSYLLELQQGGAPLSRSQQLRLRAHLSVCKLCSMYRRKLILLDKTMRRILHEAPASEVKPEELEELKERLKKKI